MHAIRWMFMLYISVSSLSAVERPVISGVLTSRSSVSKISAARTLYGQITGSNGSDSLMNVRVQIVGATIGTMTDNRGMFRLADVPDGTIRLRVQHPCFLTVEVEVPAGEDAEVSVGLPFNHASVRQPGCGGLGQRRR